jgi:hypothetical protein
MERGRFRVLGTGAMIVIAAIFFVIALANLPIGTTEIFGEFEETKDRLTFAQVVVSFFGFIGAITAFSFAVFQYRKAEKWRRMEFIAREVKELESDEAIQNALLMVDWGTREINLYLIATPKHSDFVTITRGIQWRALLPHPLKQEFAEYQEKPQAGVVKSRDAESSETEVEGRSKDLGFTVREARIRDTYDALLTRLDRLATFINADLIRENELRPFIFYWIDAMTSAAGPPQDATWRCTLLTYINFYDYSGVNELFKHYGRDISPNGKVYQQIKKTVPDQVLANRLYKCADDARRSA